MSARVVLLDSGGANLGSVQAAFRRHGVDAPVTSEAATVRAATHVILPGVGTAKNAMQRLQDNRLIHLIPKLSQPLLGICVGMQLLFEHSAEDDCRCLGLLPGRVQKLPATATARVPHMGWNQLNQRKSHPLTAGLDQSYAYFVHSYAVQDTPDELMSCTHAEPFCAVVGSERVFGAQFHPERSALAGAQLLQNFLRL